MRRKLVKQGNSALTITLPTKWLKKFNLSQGDEAEVEEIGKNLIISSQKEFSQSRASIKLSDDSDLAKRQIGYAYKKGADVLELSFDNPSMLSIIHNNLDPYLGFEIIAHGKKHCVIKNIASPNEEDLDNVLRRLFLVTLQLADGSFEALKLNNLKALQHLLYLEQINNKLTYFCKRIISKRGYLDYTKTTSIYRLIIHLEQLADHYKEIIIYFSKEENKGKKITKNNINLFYETNQYFREFYTIFNNQKEGELKKFLERKKTLQNRFETAINESDNHNLFLIFRLQIVVETLVDMAGTFYETLI